MGEASTATERFASAVARGPDLDLAEAALLIALEEYPTLAIPAYLEKLDDMGLEARDRIRQDAPLEDRIDSLNAYLFDALGFKGNEEDYYDPRNSFLNEVIDRRLGLPITLSLVYLEVARRVGVPAHGVGLPGHFIVGAGDGPGRILIDPYHGGRRLTPEECARIVAGVGGDAVPLREEQLAPVGKPQFLYRMLSNLKFAYLQGEASAKALRVIDKMSVLEPASWVDVRDRGIVLHRLGRNPDARRELRRYLANVPDAEDRPAVEATLAEIDTILRMYR